jgi:serine/threonine protein phosphatase PrpC
MGSWDSYSHTIAGRREENEDGVLILPLGEDGYFCAVADGMGGIKGGEVASATVLTAAREFLAKRFSGSVRTDQLKKVLRDLYAAADAAIRRKQKENPLLAGMGTTLATLLVKGDKYVVGNIGDSRLYRLSGGRLRQITTDHTFVQEMMAKSGKLDAGVIKRFSHVVTRSIEGGKEKPDIFPADAKHFTLEEGDGFLLCSDGLIIDKSTDQAVSLERHFMESGSLKEAAARMVYSALDAGSSDNVSVVLATWGVFSRTPGRAEEPAPRSGEEQNRSAMGASGKLTPRLVLACFALAMAVLVAFGAWSAFGSGEVPDAVEEGETVAAWQPFSAQASRTYRLSDDFSWAPYTSGEVLAYEVRFGDIGPKVFEGPVCSLKRVDGLRGGIPYRVSVVACCTDGRRVTGASGIFVFR